MLIDVLYVWRLARRSPASAVAAVLTLSLALGAAGSIFGVIDAVVLTPPPFADPDRLVAIGEIPIDDMSGTPRTVGYATFEAWRDHIGRLASIEASDGTKLTLTGFGAAERVDAINVTPGLLALLGARPALGRGFDGDDVGHPVAMVSDAFWRGKLAHDRAVIGRDIVLGGQKHTIIGVLPAEFTSVQGPADILRPFPVVPAQAIRSGYRVGVIGRLAPGASATHVSTVLSEVSDRSTPPARAIVQPIATAIARDAPRTLGALAAAAGLAILLAFVNLAGLLFVRSLDRGRELAVRIALGAQRFEIVRQLLLEAESLVLAGIAGGLLVAVWLTPVVARLTLNDFGSYPPITVSWRVVGVLAVVASACACICGMLPAVMASRWNAMEVLRRGVTAQPRELALRRVFVVVEVALAFVLLLSMTLLGRGLMQMLRVNPGFESRGALDMSVALPSAVYRTDERVVSFYSRLQSAVQGRLGPGSIAVIDELPLTHDRGRNLVSATAADSGAEAVIRAASPDYFSVMRIPVLAGRGFDWRDDASAPTRVVVSQALSSRLFGTAQPIGRRIWLGADKRAADVIGLVGDVKHRALGDPPLPTLYRSGLQAPSRGTHLVVRSERADAAVIGVVREEVGHLDPNLPVYGVQPMREVVNTSPGVRTRRVLTATFSGFALLAAVLGGVGLFGVAAHDVARRRTELALRVALGANPVRLLTMILGQGGLMVGSGLIAGAVLAVWLSRALHEFAFAADRFDLPSSVTAATILVIVGALAIMPAARRAARTDPMTVLRSE